MKSIVSSDDIELTCQLLTGIALADDLTVAHVRDELARAASLLSTGDEIYALTTASRRLMPGLLLLISDRLIFVKRRRPVGPWFQMELPYETITFVGLETLVTETLLHVRSTKRRRSISFGVFPSPEKAQEVFRLLNRLSTQARAKARYSDNASVG